MCLSQQGSWGVRNPFWRLLEGMQETGMLARNLAIDKNQTGQICDANSAKEQSAQGCARSLISRKTTQKLNRVCYAWLGWSMDWPQYQLLDCKERKKFQALDTEQTTSSRPKKYCSKALTNEDECFYVKLLPPRQRNGSHTGGRRRKYSGCFQTESADIGASNTL